MAAYSLPEKTLQIFSLSEYAKRPVITYYKYLSDLRKQDNSGDDNHVSFIKQMLHDISLEG